MDFPPKREHAFLLPDPIELLRDRDSYGADIMYHIPLFVLAGFELRHYGWWSWQLSTFHEFPTPFYSTTPTTTTQRPITRQNYLNLSYGGERYEKRDLQIRVRKRFAELKSIDEKEGRVPWHVVDASQSIEEVTTELVKIVEETVEKVTNGKPLRKMWEDGVYDLPQVAGGLVEEKKEN